MSSWRWSLGRSEMAFSPKQSGSLNNSEVPNLQSLNGILGWFGLTPPPCLYLTNVKTKTKKRPARRRSYGCAPIGWCCTVWKARGWCAGDEGTRWGWGNGCVFPEMGKAMHSTTSSGLDLVNTRSLSELSQFAILWPEPHVPSQQAMFGEAIK
jgi:hypothetical protein